MRTMKLMTEEPKDRVSRLEDLWDSVRDADEGDVIIYSEAGIIELGRQEKGKSSGYWVKERLLLKSINKLARKKDVTIKHEGSI